MGIPPRAGVIPRTVCARDLAVHPGAFAAGRIPDPPTAASLVDEPGALPTMDRPLTRILEAVVATTAALVLAACSGGGGGSSTLAADAPASQMSQTLAWEPASGPVAGYRVWVQRDGGTFEVETEVTPPQVTLTGEPGQTARIIVAAFDAHGNTGVLSPPSVLFTFPDPGASQAAAASPASAAPAASTTRSFAAAASTADSDAAPAGSEATAPVVAPQDKRSWDASGDGVADLLWESGDALRVTSALVETDLIFTRPGSGHAVAAFDDFDGDGLADPLWVGPQGDVGYTPMAALHADASRSPVVALGRLGASESVVAAGDLDGDGLADVLVRDADDGFTSVWLSNPGAPPDVAGLGTVADALAGVADYDGDGTSDVLWRGADGALVVWQMLGALVHGVVELTVPATTEILASGDFDGDGAADVAHRDTATGVVSVLRPVVGAVEGWTSMLGDTRGWTPQGAADFDGDGAADLLLAAGDELRFAYLPGEERHVLEPTSPWSLVALPR